MFKFCTRLFFLVSFCLVVPQAADAKSRTVKNPKPTSLYGAVLHGLRLIHAGKYDAWIETYCHAEQCTTPKAIKALKLFNLPTLKRRAVHCLKGKNRMSMTVTRMVKRPGGVKKIFVKCNPKGSPYPFSLKKEKKVWKWVTA